MTNDLEVKLNSLLSTESGREELLALIADVPGGKSTAIREQVRSGQLKTSGRMLCLGALESRQ
jgi:hypothetical protein